jgi:hypothetical protein
MLHHGRGVPGLGMTEDARRHGLVSGRNRRDLA